MDKLVIVPQWHGETEDVTCSECEGSGKEYIWWAEITVNCRYCDGTGSRKVEKEVIEWERMLIRLQARYGHPRPDSIRDWWMK